MKDNGFISKYGLFATIVVTVVGVGVFSYPGRMAEIVGTDGWFVTAIAGVIVLVLLSLVYRTVKKNEYETFYGMLSCNLGGIFGRVFAFILCAHFIIAISLGMRVYAEVIKMFLLENTPTEFILLAMILTGLYLVRGEVSAIVKFNEIAFVVMFLPMIIILAFATRGGQFNNVMPLLQSPPQKYLSALAIATYTFGGFEIAYLVLPYMKAKNGLKKTFTSSVALITVFYIIVTILCLMFFTKEHTKNLLWPTISLIRAIVIPGAFVERWEGIVMALWVLFYFTTFANMYYFSGDIIKDALSLKDIKLSSILLTPIIYITALYPENIAEVYDISGKVTPILSIFSFVVLPLVLLVTSSRKRRGRKDEA